MDDPKGKLKITSRNKRFWMGAALVSSELLVALGIFTSFTAGLIMAFRPQLRKHKQLDLQVFDRLHQYTNEQTSRWMLEITSLGSHQFLIPANLLLIIYFLFIRKHTWFSIRVGAIALSSLFLMIVLKQLFHRKRPLIPLLEEAKGLSFPSGHAIMSTTFYGLLIYIVARTITNKPAKILLIIFLVLLIQSIGFSRVYLRVHYASDVLVGYIIGLLWLVVSLNVLFRLEQYNKQKVKELVVIKKEES